MQFHIRILCYHFLFFYLIYLNFSSLQPSMTWFSTQWILRFVFCECELSSPLFLMWQAILYHVLDPNNQNPVWVFSVVNQSFIKLTSFTPFVPSITNVLEVISLLLRRGTNTYCCHRRLRSLPFFFFWKSFYFCNFSSWVVLNLSIHFIGQSTRCRYLPYIHAV